MCKLNHYVSDFVEEFNYSGIILYVAEEINLDKLFLKLSSDNLSHMSRFDGMRDNRIFYIENCDLFTVKDNEIKELVEENYTITTLHHDKNGFYVKVWGE